MDLELLKRGLNIDAKIRKKWVLLATALGLSGFVAHRVYHSPSVVRKRERLLKLFSAFVTITEAIADSAELVGVISKDLNEYVKNDCNNIPNSLRQISKIARSDEFSESLIKITRAITVGILKGYQDEGRNVGGDDTSFSDKVLNKLFSSGGSGFASVVVGSFARNMVMAYYAHREPSKGSSVNWVDMLYEDKCRELVGDCVKLFVSSAVSVYLEKTMDINPYEEILSAVTKPDHEEKAKEIFVTVCNGAVESFVRTSHQVLTSSNSSGSKSAYLPIEFGKNAYNALGGSRVKKLIENSRGSGWVSKMSSTLAVPSNKKFVIDLTGRMTFETVRSMLEFLLHQLTEFVKRSVNLVQEEVIDRGVVIFRCISTNSSTVFTVCLSLCLHILNSPWSLVPPSEVCISVR